MTATPAPRVAARRAALAVVSIVSLVSLAACDLTSTKASDNTDSKATMTCDLQKECKSPKVSLGETSLVVTADPSADSQTVSVELVDNQPLHCVTAKEIGGATAIFSNTGLDAAKTIAYTVTGKAAENAKAAYAKHPKYLGCYGSTNDFSGYAGGRSNTAVWVEEDGLFEAALLSCDDVQTQPCFRYSDTDTSVTVTVSAPAGDPKLR